MIKLVYLPFQFEQQLLKDKKRAKNAVIVQCACQLRYETQKPRHLWFVFSFSLTSYDVVFFFRGTLNLNFLVKSGPLLMILNDFNTLKCAISIYCCAIRTRVEVNMIFFQCIFPGFH